jgi:hypothetical protein
MWDRDYWRNYKKTIWNPDYLRWRARRRWVSLGLLILTLILLSPVLYLYERFDVHSAWGLIFLGFCVLVLFVIYRMLGWTGQRYRPPADNDRPPDTPLAAIVLDESNVQSGPAPRPDARLRPEADRSGCRPWLIAIGVLGLICVLACGGVVALVTWKAWERIHHRPPPTRFGAVGTTSLEQQSADLLRPRLPCDFCLAPSKRQVMV